MIYYTTIQIRKMLGGCTRDYVSKLARARKWRFITYPINAYIAGKKYLAEDVDKELARREAKKLEQMS